MDLRDAWGRPRSLRRKRAAVIAADLAGQSNRTTVRRDHDVLSVEFSAAVESQAYRFLKIQDAEPRFDNHLVADTHHAGKLAYIRYGRALLEVPINLTAQSNPSLLDFDLYLILWDTEIPRKYVNRLLCDFLITREPSFRRTEFEAPRR